MKKFISLMFLLMVSLVLVACGGEGTNGESKTEKEVTYVEPGAQKITIYTRTFEEWHQKWLRKLVNDFNSDLEDGIQVEVKFYTEDTFADALVVARENGKAPDIFISTYGDLYTNYNNNWCSPIDEYLTDAQKNDFFDGALDMVTYGGHMMAYPWNLEPGSLLFYRKDLLANAGVTSIPKTWEELYAACAKIKTGLSRGKYCLGLPLGQTECSWVSYGLQMNTTGGLALNDDWSETRIDNEGYKDIARFFYNIYYNGYAPIAGITDEGYVDIVEALCDGKVAMTFAGSWSVSYIYDYLTEEEDKAIINQIGVAPIPTRDGNQDIATSSNGGWCYCISKASKHKDMAAKFLNYMFVDSAEVTAQYFIAAYNSKSPTQQSVKDYLDSITVVTPSEWIQVINDVASKGFPEAIYPWDIASEVGGIFATMQLNAKTDTFDSLYSKALLTAKSNIATVMSRSSFPKNPKLEENQG